VQGHVAIVADQAHPGAGAGRGLGCFWVARRKIAAVKNADGWFAGLRQTVVTDTSWRTDPPRFPVRWLIPALAVIAATVAVGALRYPGLPAHIVTGSGHRVPKLPSAS
jgi:uncharacterized membrane protein